MTVGIAVLCEGGKSAVVVADRLVSAPVPGTNASALIDMDHVKLTELAPGVLVVFSGNAHDGALALKKLGDPSGIEPERLATKLRQAWTKVVTAEANAKLRVYGLEVSSVQSEKLTGHSLGLVENALKAARAGEFLLVIRGVEQIWIYVVSDQYRASYDQTGFAAVGSGSTFSVPVLAAKRVHKAIELEHALYAAFETKRASEGIGTVGSQTDMAIVAVGHPTRFLSGELIEELEAMYQRRLVLAKSEKNTIRRLIGA
jgi:non-canonical (house-cleaning) NTP pyrophosphatase